MSGRRASVAPLFAALGDETRLKLMDRLAVGERLSIAQLTSGSNVTRQAITKHLSVLAAAGLVHSIRRGRLRLFRIEPRRLRRARRYFDLISRQWDDALGRLREVVESPPPVEASIGGAAAAGLSGPSGRPSARPAR